MEEIKLAYLAGIVDGEGCFVISRRANGSYFRLEVTSTNLALCEYLKKNYNGCMRISYRGREGKNHKQAYRWEIEGKKAVSLIRELYPHLIIKKAVAEILLANNGNPDDCREQIHKLNHKGLLVEDSN